VSFYNASMVLWLEITKKSRHERYKNTLEIPTLIVTSSKEPDIIYP